LRVRRLHSENPALSSEPIERPIVIVGLPRTATTLTHNIIARTEGHRAPLLWELNHTDLQKSPEAEAAVIRDVDRGVRAVLRLAPAFWSIHPQGATKPDDCPFLLPHGFQHLARAPLPASEARLRERDYGPDYDYLKQAPQVLQYGRPRHRWVLKSPTHLESLLDRVQVSPDCSIVWMHRDPVTVLGSIRSLVETSMLLHVRRPDLDYIGQMCLRLTRRLVERGRAARDKIAPERLVDVPYDWLVADPHASMPFLYDLLGANWTDQDAAALESIVRRPAHRNHEYVCIRYGLDVEEINAAFGDYSKFALLRGPTRRRQ